MTSQNISYLYKTFSLLIFTSMLLTAQDSFKPVQFTTEDKGVIHGSLFKANSKQATVFAHGMIFNKESWYGLAERFQSEGITALSIDFRGYGESTGPKKDDKKFDVLGAIQFLVTEGYDEVNVVGGSMGAMATLDALAERADSRIAKVVLLAPPYGKPLSSRQIDKLVVVAKEERFYTQVTEIYEKISEPKELKVYKGDAHAQHLFNSEHADDLTERIVAFIKG